MPHPGNVASGYDMRGKKQVECATTLRTMAGQRR
jgi:hypothetical protein